MRLLLLFDAAVLLLVGGGLAISPQGMIKAFQFPPVDPHYYYTHAMWGSVLVTLAIGNIWCAQDPWRHRAWLSVSVLRGVCEALISAAYLATGMATFRQAGLGLVMGILIAAGYGGLSPREGVK